MSLLSFVILYYIAVVKCVNEFLILRMRVSYILHELNIAEKNKVRIILTAPIVDLGKEVCAISRLKYDNS